MTVKTCPICNLPYYVKYGCLRCKTKSKNPVILAAEQAGVSVDEIQEFTNSLSLLSKYFVI